MKNDYLRDKAMKRDYRRSGRRDMRNPYGSRGGYVRDKRYDDYEMDYGYDYPERSHSDYRRYDGRYDDERDYRDMEHHREHHRPYEYEMYGVGGMRPVHQDHRDYRRDYSEEDMEKEYEEKLHEWISKLKKKDKFNLPKEEVIKKAKEMNVKFTNFDETELYAVYLMLVSDFRQLSSEPHRYIAMAKEWLEDDDIARKGSEKVCAYLYSIVLGEDE